MALALVRWVIMDPEAALAALLAWLEPVCAAHPYVAGVAASFILLWVANAFFSGLRAHYWLCTRAVENFVEAWRRAHVDVADDGNLHRPVFGPHPRRAIGKTLRRQGDIVFVEVACPSGACPEAPYACTIYEHAGMFGDTDFTRRCGTCGTLYYVHVHVVFVPAVYPPPDPPENRVCSFCDDTY